MGRICREAVRIPASERAAARAGHRVDPTATLVAPSAPTPPPSPSPDPTRPRRRRPRRSRHAPAAPRLAYAAFLRRINDDRATVERLNASLTTAVQALDPVAARSAAVDILDFVDAERDWLRENPPAACYADAHTSARRDARRVRGAADAFIAWAETGGGIAGLSALGDALDVAKTAGDSLTTFGHVLETTSCPA